MKKEIEEIKKRLAQLENVVFTNTESPTVYTENGNIDFSLNERAFIKQYSSGFNGQEFFTLILSYVAGGNEATAVELQKIKDIWRRCFGMIKTPYASIFSTRAKECGWVDVVKDTRASYILSKNWQNIFKKNDKNT